MSFKQENSIKKRNWPELNSQCGVKCEKKLKRHKNVYYGSFFVFCVLLKNNDSKLQISDEQALCRSAETMP